MSFVQDTLESFGAPPIPLALPVTLIGPLAGSQISNEATGYGQGLAWQSSIGQFIFLESIERERI